MSLRHLNTPIEAKSIPLPEDWVLEGAPAPRGAVLVRSADGSQRSGRWQCETGRFHYSFRSHETAHILKGVALIQETEGENYTIRAGDVVHFPKGLKTTWNVIEPIEKIFFLVE